MEITITVECPDGSTLRATALSFGRAVLELAALESKYEKLYKNEDIPL